MIRLRGILGLVLWGSAACRCVAQTPAGVQNGGFEAWNTLWPWVQSGASQQTYTNFHSGSFSLYFAGQVYPASVYQDVSVNNNTPYLVSAWIQTFNGGSMVFSVDDSQNSSSSVSLTTATNGSWQYVSIPFTSNLSGKLRIHLQQATGLSVSSVDDVSVVPLAPVGNYGFEAGSLQFWTAAGGALPSLSTTSSHTGSGSVAIPATSSASGVYQDITVTAGTQYVASAWVLAPSGTSAQLYLDDSQSSAVTSATVPAASGVWQNVSLPFVATATGKIRIHLWQSGTGTVNWDDVALAPVLPTANAGFESGSAQYWTSTGGASPAASNTGAHSGTWSLAIPATASASGAYQDVVVTNLGQYTISAWVQAPTGTSVTLHVDDSQGGYATSASVPAASGVWQYVSTTFTADTTGLLRVSLLESGTGTVYWDDISVAAAGSVIQQPYTFDYSANPVYNDTSRWQTNGSATYSSGVTFAGTGGALISLPAVSGANANDSETDTTLALKAGGGTYIQFFRASSSSVQAGSGSYVSVEITVPSGFQSPGTATLSVNQCSNGTVTQIGSSSVTASDGMTVKSVIFGSTLYVFLNNVYQGSFTVPSMTGNPGVGGYGIPSGSGITSVKLGPHYTIAPPAVTLSTVASSVFPTQISLRWQGVSEGTSGVGVFQYRVLRNGVDMGTVEQASFADSTVQAGTVYTYTVLGDDYHGNWAQQSPNIQVTTPPAQSIDPRRVGLFTTGSYWGGGGEQIDTLSGNLNFTLPLLTAMGRAGWKVPLGLSYNAQNWRKDGAANWQLGSDVGYGFGWQARIGSITPYYTNWLSGPDHFVFTDGTGAEYRLDQNSGGIWSSSQGIFVWFDVATNTLHFKDGTFWKMGCTSGGSEPDAGTLYPTIMEDVNGNQVLVTYRAGGGLPASATNTSARFSTIEDVRGLTYLFTWNADAPTPHLARIDNIRGTGETFAFTYVNAQTLTPPFGPDPAWSAATTTLLGSIIPNGSPGYPVITPYQFTYDAAGAAELTQVKFPYGGHLRWTYANDTYIGSRSLRAVNGRYLAADSGGLTEWTYGISRDNASGSVIHSTMTLTDASGVGAKTWTFLTPGGGNPAWKVGLISQFTELASAGGTVLHGDEYTWSQTPTSGNPYISSKTSVMNPGGANSASATTTQTEDQYGNVTQAVVYPYNNTTTPLNTYNNTWLSSGSYLTNYIRNRLLTTTLTTGGVTKTLVNNYYDGQPPAKGQPTPSCGVGSTWSSPYSPYGYQAPTAEFDANPPLTFANRGTLSATTSPAKTTCMTHYSYGGFAQGTATDGTSVTASADPATNYAAPQTVTNQSYTETIAYNPWLAITQTTGANGEQLSMAYDAYTARPTSATSPFGSVISYSYSGSAVLPAWQAKSGPDGITTTTLDGLGRAIKVARSDSTGVKGYVDTVYSPCACSPLGKVQQVSAPYAPNTASNLIGWTVYTYDGLGRTVSVRLPDGASTTVTAYSGNQTTVTDPAGKWKTFTSDVQGNLISVVEPDPANQPGGTVTTTYAFDWMNHLTGVSMPRSGTTQTRTFVYDDAGRLTSTTNPENGTVLYYYNADNTLHYKHDAKGQDTVYTYDAAKRVTLAQRFPNGQSNPEDTCQQVSYSYSSNPYDSGYSQYATGRLTATQHRICTANATLTEMYSYNPAGGVVAKRFHIYKPWYDDQYSIYRDAIADVDVAYSYTSFGSVSQSLITYPFSYSQTNTGLGMYYGFDSMGRPVSLADNNPYSANGYSTTWVKNVVYDYAGRLSSWNRYRGSANNYSGNPVDTYAAEALTYTNGQLTQQSWSYDSANSPGYFPPSTTGITYTYSPSQNNGQITGISDTVSGETIVYQYDQLKRLSSATSAPNTGSTPAAWNQTFQYDGFGNLTAKVLNGNTTSIAVNGATNRLTNASYDLNGNMTVGNGATLGYDEANRIVTATPVSGGTENYGYAPDNKRIYKKDALGNELWTFYGAHEEKMSVFTLGNPVTVYLGPGIGGGYRYPVVDQGGPASVTFAGRRIWDGGTGGGAVMADRLGTNRSGGARFYPYGEEISSTANNRMKFGTYTRDGFTGLDYADQRFYASSYGRFNTPDPYKASGGANDPGSWNRYAYVGGDPANFRDPRGLIKCLNCSGDDGGGDSGGDGGGGGGGGGGCTQARSAGSASLGCSGNDGNDGGGSSGDSFSDDMREQAHSIISSLSAHCQEQLGQRWNLFDGQNSLLYKTDASNPNAVNFYDGRTAAVATSTLSSWGWQGQGTKTVATFFSQHKDLYGFVSQVGGKPSNGIILGSLFFDGLTPDLAQAGILHEVLHSYTGLNDADLAARLGLGQLVNPEASGEITWYLDHDCRPQHPVI